MLYFSIKELPAHIASAILCNIRNVVFYKPISWISHSAPPILSITNNT